MRYEKWKLLQKNFKYHRGLKMRMIKALNIVTGSWESHDESVWASIKNVTVKYLRQRLSLGYSENEAVNAPFGTSIRQRRRSAKDRDAVNPMWKVFVTSGVDRRKELEEAE